MAVKLSDVAKLAGVSPTTVSRVINDYGYISDKTRNKVHQAMRELNYQPNSLARSLHGKHTKLVGLIFPGASHPFFGELIEKIEEELFAAGYKTILCNAGDDKEKEREYLRMLLANQVDGVIAGAHNIGIEEYNQAGLPIVAFDRQLSDQVPIVSSDNYQGGVLATEELYQAGCRSIYFVGNPKTRVHPTENRLAGYQEVIKKYNLTSHIHSVTFAETTTYKAMLIRDLLQTHKVDGVVCTDDLTALLVINIARELGRRIPEDVKVIGYDGTQFIRQYHPELSTVVQPIGDIAKVLVDLLQRRIKEPKQAIVPKNYTLPVTLLRRSSSR